MPILEPVPLRTLLPVALGTRAVVEVEVYNPGTKRLRLHRQPTVPVELVSEADGRRVVARAQPRGVIRPGETRETRVHVELPLEAPPGVYTGKMEVAGKSQPIRLVVPLRQRLQLAPTRLAFEAPLGSNPVVDLSLANAGNLPVTVSDPPAVRMEPRERSCRILRQALVLANAQQNPLPILDAVVRAAAESTAADPILAVSLAGAPITLAPGEARLVRVTLRVPDLDRGSYQARLVIGGNRLVVNVHSNGRKGGGQP